MNQPSRFESDAEPWWNETADLMDGTRVLRQGVVVRSRAARSTTSSGIPVIENPAKRGIVRRRDAPAYADQREERERALRLAATTNYRRFEAEERHRPGQPDDRAAFSADLSPNTARRIRAQLVAHAPKTRGPWISAANAAAIAGITSAALRQAFDAGHLCQVRLAQRDGTFELGVWTADLATYMRHESQRRQLSIARPLSFES